ncbi:MAG TPA: hypothetical protein VIF62_25485 [Labilithrix sp.]
MIPGWPRSVLLLFAAPATRFDELAPTFEQMALATKGAMNPEAKSHAPSPTEFLVLVLIAGGVFGWIRVRGRKRTTPD